MLFRKGDLVKAFIFLMLIEVLTAFGTLIYLATSVNSMPNWGLGLTMSVTFFVVMVDCILGILIFKVEGIKEIGTIKVFEEDLQNPTDLFSPVSTKSDETLDDEVDLEFISNISGDELFGNDFDVEEDEVELEELKFTSRSRSDFLEHKTSLQPNLDETYDTFRNEFLAYVFNDSIDLPEEYPKDSKDEVTTLLGGSYLSDVLYYLPEGSRLYFQNRLKKEYQEYEITFSSEGYGVYYRLK
jgi:hypothetical protein